MRFNRSNRSENDLVVLEELKNNKILSIKTLPTQDVAVYSVVIENLNTKLLEKMTEAYEDEIEQSHANTALRLS